MAEPQPKSVHEGATGGDIEDEIQETQAKSAEDRKAAAALASLDTQGDGAQAEVDANAVSKAMKNLGSSTAAKKDVKKVKVDAADVTLLVSFLLCGYRTQSGIRKQGKKGDN
ncbi:hypothetical protein GGR57DRAFT_459335, partial [Xylariaceae sp. FL1272]